MEQPENPTQSRERMPKSLRVGEIIKIDYYGRDYRWFECDFSFR